MTTVLVCGFFFLFKSLDHNSLLTPLKYLNFEGFFFILTLLKIGLSFRNKNFLLVPHCTFLYQDVLNKHFLSLNARGHLCAVKENSWGRVFKWSAQMRGNIHANTALYFNIIISLQRHDKRIT